MCTTLFLSRKVTSRPDPVCAQPSGYFIDHPPDALSNTRKTWLSGMSPVARLALSDVSAPTGAGGAHGAVVSPAGGTVAGDDVVGVAGAAPVEKTVDDEEPPPQPAMAAARGTMTAAISRRCMARGWSGPPERHLIGRGETSPTA